MKHFELEARPLQCSIGQTCEERQPNITGDTIFYEAGIPVGFYIRDIGEYSEKAAYLADIADRELRSNRVPKTEMSRGPQGNKKQKLERAKAGKELVTQFSVILGGIAPKPHMRRDYPTVSSVHAVQTARNYIKAMRLLCAESEAIIRQLMPEQYESQKKLIAENSPKQFRFGDLFTSSIANFNVAAAYHQDNANLKGCSNVIITKRKDSIGGNTHVPEYDITVDSADNSMLFYPAWKNIHGVTPIRATGAGGFRNSLVFYPLKGFRNFV